MEVTEQRTMQDYAKVLRWLVDEVYPHAEYIRLVHNNLNTHTPASLYETFPPAEARRILQRIEFHYTPKHGSWLNMAEIEFAIFERTALSRRLPDEEALHRQVSTVETERNQQHRGISWQFTSRDALVKLSRLYPGERPRSGVTRSGQRPGPLSLASLLSTPAGAWGPIATFAETSRPVGSPLKWCQRVVQSGRRAGAC